jgi:hypothetical protein
MGAIVDNFVEIWTIFHNHGKFEGIPCPKTQY